MRTSFLALVLVAVAGVIFSAWWLFKLPALPFAEAQTLALVQGGGGEHEGAVDWSCWEAVQERRDLFSRVAVSSRNERVIGEGQGSETVQVLAVSADFFETLGVAPAFGRLFMEHDQVSSQPRVGVLGNEIWQQRFAGEPNIIGTVVRVEGIEAKILGVMPPGFHFPSQGDRVDVILQLAESGTDRDEALSLLVRQRTDVEAERVELELAALGEERCGPLSVVALTEVYFEA